VRFHESPLLTAWRTAPAERRTAFVYITQTFQRLSIDLLDHDLFADHEPWEVFNEL